MIKICDRTLSCLDGYSATTKQLTKLITLLLACDADYLELSEKTYQTLGGLLPFGNYVLRIHSPEQADQYPEFDRFVCPKKYDEKRHVIGELIVHDSHDATLIMQHGQDRMLRITGFDQLFQLPVESSLLHIKKLLPKKNEFCPGNAYKSGVAAAMEWINMGCGDTIVTSFGGIGGFAPFEQVLIALRQIFRRHPQTQYEVLPQICDILEDITEQPFSLWDPITGSGIFTVESGIHIQGILQHPRCFEPFPPESVGGKRKFTYGKFSGTASVRYKVQEMGFFATEEEIHLLTQKIKEKAEAMNKSLSDEEFREITQQVLLGGREDEGKATDH